MGKKRRAFIVCAALCAAPLCFALPGQKIIPVGYWVYDALAALSLESGVPFFLDSALTMAEAETQLSLVEYASLSDSAKTLYNRVHEYLGAPANTAIHSDAVNLEFGMTLSPEFYFKTNKNIPWDYTHNERRPFAVLHSDISVLPYVNLGADFDIGKSRSGSVRHDNYDNFPFHPDELKSGDGGMDINFPHRAYLSAGLRFGEFSLINFRIGRGDTGIGRTHMGSVILGDNLRGLDYAELSVFSPTLRYSCNVIEAGVNRYLYLHVFQVSLFSSLIVSFCEGAMVNAPFELRYLNPMMIIHGFAAWDDYGGYNDELVEPSDGPFRANNSRVGSIGALIIDWRPFKGIRCYGMAAMNEFQVPNIESITDNAPPNALAFLAGLESTVFVHGGYVTLGAEAVYTYPYMYMLRHKNWSFYREVSELGYDGFVQEWLGTPLGPDTIAALLWAGYNSHALWSLSASFVFSAQGENSNAEIMNTDYWPASGGRSAKTPTGVPVYTYKMSLQGAWQLRGGFSVSSRPALVFINNNGHVPGVFEWGCELNLSLAWRVI
jgi:hypothetical protein